MEEFVVNLGISGKCGSLVFNCILIDFCYSFLFVNYFSYVYLLYGVKCIIWELNYFFFLKIWDL